MIIVISRVVLRLRQQQLSTDLQSHVTRVSGSRVNKVQDLAGLLAPNQISVQRFRNRLSFLAHNIKNSWHKSYQDISAWRQQRVINKAAAKLKATTPPTIPAAHDSSSTNQTLITAPQAPLRAKLAVIAQQATQFTAHNALRIKRQASTKMQAVKNKISSISTHPSLQGQTNKPTLNQPAQPVGDTPSETKIKKATVLRMVNTDQPASPAPKPSPVIKQMGQPVKAGSISQLFKKEPRKSPLQQAEEALAKLQTEKAEDLLVPYLLKHPKDTNAYMMLGQAAVSRHAWGEATEIFEQVIKLKPETEGCYAALGQAALEAGNLTKAIETLQRAHDQNPQNVSVIKCLLRIAQRMDNLPMQRSLNIELQQLEKTTTANPAH